ncbi:MAG: hypothetical protein QF432_04850, partial [Dehalococcoidales bacterium]|nr:hypothetical protein [Dehalococcoidales bacterium]
PPYPVRSLPHSLIEDNIKETGPAQRVVRPDVVVASADLGFYMGGATRQESWWFNQTNLYWTPEKPQYHSAEK